MGMKMFVVRLFYFLLFSFIIINFGIIVVVTTSLVGSWKMKVCLNGSTYEITQEQCRFGVWFTEPKKIQRICFENGMWAFYKEWCNSNPIIWTTHPGRKGCVAQTILSSGDIIGIVHLGNANSGAVMSTLRRRLFFNNDKQKDGSKWDFLDSDVEILTWGKISQSLLEIVNYQKNHKCFIKGHNAFFANYKLELESNNNAELILEENICMKKIYSGTKVQVLPSEIEFDIIQSQSESMDFQCTLEKDNKIENKEYNEYNEICDDSVSRNEILKIVDEQTLRIALRFYATHFNHDKVPAMDFEEWKFLEIAKNIFENVCTDKLVPNIFYDHILPLFQFLLLESFKIFPPKEDTDDSARIRIDSAISECLRQSKPFEYSYKETCSTGAPLLNGKNADGKPVLKLVEVPPFLTSDTEKYDLILEATWKLMMFTHYYCADYFKSFSSDLSLLHQRWQSLFAPDLLRRWKNPGKSYEMMKKIFMSINLEKAIKNVDYCLAAAHLDSVYQGWIKRPLSRPNFIKPKGRRVDQMIWDGNAHCMDDYMYPAKKLQYPIEKCGVRIPNRLKT